MYKTWGEKIIEEGTWGTVIYDRRTDEKGPKEEIKKLPEMKEKGSVNAMEGLKNVKQKRNMESEAVATEK